MCNGSGPRSNGTLSTQRSSSRSAAWGTRRDPADSGMERSAVNPGAVGTPSAPAPAERRAPSAAPPEQLPPPEQPAPGQSDGQPQRPSAAQRDARDAWEMALRRKKWVRWAVSWLPHRLTIGVRTALRWEHLVVGKVRQRWHRSLQLRVVGTTLVISATVIAVLGFFLTEQIAEGLLLNAEHTARTQTLAGLNAARSLTAQPLQPTSGESALRF